ncbi:MAG: MBL fold metallo-hydrolase [Deltaproteobacteria bacterium]|nr:MBL fold metallo-hydrolase [Deltaproteobacteria bacterium]
MRLQFLGATETVTGSKYCLSQGDHSWLIDCGLFQGLKELRRRNWHRLPVDEAKLDAVLLTHAHIDHTGYLPVLVKHGFEGPIYASAPTIELCKLMLPDAGYIQEEDARFAATKGFSKHASPQALYTYDDAVRSLKQLTPVVDCEWLDLSPGVRAMYRPSGHILGSRFINISVEEKHRHFNIFFGGDIGRYDALIAIDPGKVKSVTYLLLEATYGEKLHPEEDVYARFEKIIMETVARGGKVLIPAFAVSRTQQILYILRKLENEGRLPPVPIYLNSPLAIDATSVYKQFIHEQNFFSNGTPTEDVFHPSRLTMVHEASASKHLNHLEGPAIIISSSGMLIGGRILHHLKYYLPDPASTLVLTGFQAEGTRGRALLDGAKSIKVHGQDVAVRAHIEFVESLSAHGDWKDIMRWLKGFERPPHTTFLIHGEQSALGALKQKIEDELRWNVVIPRYFDRVDL